MKNAAPAAFFVGWAAPPYKMNIGAADAAHAVPVGSKIIEPVIGADNNHRVGGKAHPPYGSYWLEVACALRSFSTAPTTAVRAAPQSSLAICCMLMPFPISCATR